MNTDIQSSKTPQELISIIKSSQEQLEGVKLKLANLIENLHQSPSTFNWLTQKWQQLSLMNKVILTVLFCTPLLIGMLAQIAILMALGSSLCLFLGLSIYLLENHKNQFELCENELKKPIETIIDVLKIIIRTLSTSSILLANGVSHLQNTNKEVAQRCTTLVEEIKQITGSNILLDKSLQELLEQHKNLKSSLKTTDEMVLEQRANLERCQSVLDETMNTYQLNQQELTTKIVELNSVKQSLAAEIIKVHELSSTLKKTVLTFTNKTLTEELDRVEFLHQFNCFLQNQEATLQKTSQTITDSNTQLALAVIQMNDNNTRFKALLDEQEKAVVYLEELQDKPFKSTTRHGLFSQFSPSAIDFNPVNTTLAL